MKRFLLFLLCISSWHVHAMSGFIKKVNRLKLCEDLTGMSEENLRILIDWDKHWRAQPTSVGVDPKNFQQLLLQANPRSAAIFQGTFEIATIQDLRNKVGNKKLSTKPSFNIIIHDPTLDQLSDIRYLQAIPENKNALFQLASTAWLGFEGGIAHPNTFVRGMIEHSPVQGENAQSGCYGQALRLKYFRDYSISTNDNPMYQFNNLRNRMPWYWVGTGNNVIKNWKDAIGPDLYRPRIDDDTVTLASFADNTLLQIQVGIGKDVVVTSGYGNPGPEGEQIQVPVVINADGSFNRAQSQIINHLFTSAYNLRNIRAKDTTNFDVPPDVAKICQLILDAGYEGTFLAALDLGVPAFCTILGGGAFYNDVRWIAKSFIKYQEFIKERGLSVSILYRPDKFRPGKAGELRNAAIDEIFLTNLVQVAENINGTKAPQSFPTNLSNYLHYAYQYEKQKFDAEKQKKDTPKPSDQFIQAIQAIKKDINFITAPGSAVPVSSVDANLIILLKQLSQQLAALRAKLSTL